MGILITSGNGISYFYGDGMQESQGNKDFVLTKNLLALIEKNGSLVCIPFMYSSYECERQ